MHKLSLVEYKVPVYKAQHESVWIKHLKVSIKKKKLSQFECAFFSVFFLSIIMLIIVCVDAC